MCYGYGAGKSYAIIRHLLKYVGFTDVQASPKSPDFKHKTTNEALWVVSRNTPTWVPLQLEKLEAARQEFIASGGGNRGQNNRSFSGAEFKDF